MHGKNLIQLIKTLDLLSRPQGCTKKELARALNVSDRTVSRKLNELQDLEIPIYDEKVPFEKQKRWHIESTYVDRLPNLTLPKIALSYAEIISLCMMAGESVIFKGTEIDRQITTALSKLMHFIPQDTKNQLSALKRIFLCKTMGSKTYIEKNTIIQTLTESILDRKACAITYHAFYSDQIKDETIGPLHFYENSGGLYLFALKLSVNKVRSYAVERIQRIRKLGRNVDYPADFNPEQRLNSAFDIIHGDPVSVKVRFSPDIARYIKEKQWAEVQNIQDHKNGAITLSMTTSGYRDVKRWVMSFGKDAQLLEPEEMRMEIEEELEEMLGMMKKN